ncbi:ABC transporter substrate-binding protein [Nocardiopsis gilva YIM 90087]|uniref:ABC transporter substrate-binding protein n=1 Tax=Nocardiopsis gilva YIM 90087 TaxID=1235441 RepID=A0A223SCW3_9ACTN|nr:glutamate ABC transporter substrate-binding protein [Nocardiopsis gilva]ASU85859.1 ABC transporter substrate-binding protein [Nocardiopsis gilva YIM 90087]
MDDTDGTEAIDDQRSRIMRVCGSVIALGAVLAVTACGLGVRETDSIVNGEGELKIAVKPDQPGISSTTGEGEFEGFDVDVAHYIARSLGYTKDDVKLSAVSSNQREDVLLAADEKKRVDLVVASYSITPERKTRIAFGGPYYVAHQDILVAAGDDSVDDVHDLKGKVLCQEKGSNSANRITKERGIEVKEVVEAATYGGCADQLANGDVDAVSTDDLILAGYMQRAPGKFRLVNAPFTDERYGVGVSKDDLTGCEAVNTAITQMYQDGTGRKLLAKWFGATGLQVTESVPQFEGCE